MPPGFSIKLARDDVTPQLQRLMRNVKNPQPLLRAIGVGLVGLTKETFNNSALRPIAWQAKKDGTPSTLKSREASLWRSIKVQAVTAKGVLIGSDKAYAAIHQLGGRSRPMPARPYFPVWQNQITKEGQQRMKEIIEAWMAKR